MGELSAAGTAVFWAISATLFTIGGNRVGAEAVNLVRLYFGFVFICIGHWLVTGSVSNLNVESWRHAILFLSAFVGLVIGDGALFFAFVRIGPRLAMLIMSLVPVVSAVFAKFCFDEDLNRFEIMAIVFSVLAIGYVVAEDRSDQQPDTATLSRKQFWEGVFFALIGVLGQTGNLIITKYALADDFSTLTATQIRIFYSMITLTLWAVLTGSLKQIFASFADRKATIAIAFGAFFGPFVGIWLSYLAICYSRIAIASVIMATPPLLLIPISAYFFKEKVTTRSVVGTALAFIGIACLIAFGSEESDKSTPNNKTTQSFKLESTS